DCRKEEELEFEGVAARFRNYADVVPIVERHNPCEAAEANQQETQIVSSWPPSEDRRDRSGNGDENSQQLILGVIGTIAKCGGKPVQKRGGNVVGRQPETGKKIGKEGCQQNPPA